VIDKNKLLNYLATMLICNKNGREYEYSDVTAIEIKNIIYEEIESGRFDMKEM
jgi:hypothetical protein